MRNTISHLVLLSFVSCLVACGGGSSNSNSPTTSSSSVSTSSPSTSSTSTNSTSASSIVSSQSSAGLLSSSSVASLSSVASSAASSASSVNLTTNFAISGTYISLGNGSAGSLLGDATQETKLLEFSRDNGINYFIFYDLNRLVANSARATQLASLINRARTQYGIKQIGAALGDTIGANNIVAYNNAHAVNERVDVLNLESEFWNETDRASALNNVINILDSFKSLAQTNNLETEYYIGWLNNVTEGARIGNAVDRVLIHFYRRDDVEIINYGIERLQYLSTASRKVRIAPIFSNEGPTNTGDPSGYFMGPWLNTHPNDQAFSSWISAYNSLNASWKSNLEVMGGTWFLYNYFPIVYTNKPNHITSSPISQTVCVGDTKTLTVASSATNKKYCWMKDGNCLMDGEHFSGSETASLTIANITNAELGNYTARVISYDTNNPTSFAANSATITLDASCGGAVSSAANSSSVSSVVQSSSSTSSSISSESSSSSEASSINNSVNSSANSSQASSASSSSVAAVNVLNNASFENVLTNWSDWGGLILDSTDAHTGNASLKISAADGGGAQEVVYSGQPTLTVGAWAKVSVAGEGAYFGVDCLDANGARIPDGHTSVGPVTSLTWSYIEAPITIVSGTVKLNVFVYHNPGPGSVSFDDIVLY
jgi:hypothetical protein